MQLSGRVPLGSIPSTSKNKFQNTIKIGYKHAKNVWNLHFYTIHKISSRWIKDLNVKPKRMKFLKENKHWKQTKYNIGLGKFFCMWHQKQAKAKVKRDSPSN